MTQTILQHIKSAMMCEELYIGLAISEESLNLIDEKRDNCGEMSLTSQVDDIRKANEKILIYINSIRNKQRIVTPAQISKQLGFSQDFVESILIANGFQEDY